MKRSIRLAAALAGSALVLVAAPVSPAGAQPATHCLATYQDKVFTSSMGQVVVYEPPETVTLYPGNAVAPVLYIADATVGYVRCVLSGT